MGILKDQLKQSSLGLKGSTPAQREGAKNSSKLHYTDSLSVAKLDLDGVAPEIAGKVPYLNNLPE